MREPSSSAEENLWTRARALRPALAEKLRASAVGETEPGMALGRAVDASGHGLADWLDSLAVMQEWLALHPRPAPWLLRLGYIGCASDYARSRVGSLPLAEVVRDFLDSHGFDGAAGV